MWHWAETGAPGRKAQRRAFVLCAPIQLTQKSFRRPKISQLNLCSIFFKCRKEVDLLFSPPKNDFLAITWRFLNETANCPQWRRNPRLSPPCTIVSRVDHYQDLPNPLLTMFCVIFSSARLSRCCDCKIQTVGLLKAERETVSRLRTREVKKLWAHLQRN